MNTINDRDLTYWQNYTLVGRCREHLWQTKPFGQIIETWRPNKSWQTQLIDQRYLDSGNPPHEKPENQPENHSKWSQIPMDVSIYINVSPIIRFDQLLSFWMVNCSASRNDSWKNRREWTIFKHSFVLGSQWLQKQRMSAKKNRT